MELKILIATPDRDLGAQISQALTEAHYLPLLAPSTAEAAFIVQDEQCPIAILDCELPDPGPAYLAAELRNRFRDLRIIFMHRGDDRAAAIEIDPARDLHLPRPFFMPDLLEVIHLWGAESIAALAEAQPPEDPPEIPTELAWLQDVNRAAQYLTRLSLEVDAQAALIVRNARIWAYAGQLSQTAAEELTQFVGHQWVTGDARDLARFIRLETTGNEYMLYITSLGSGFRLALSFEAEMPFSKMRAQTGELARKLTAPLPDPPAMLARDSAAEVSPAPRDQPHPSPEIAAPELEADPASSEADWAEDDALIAQQQAMFEELLATLDIPDPDGASGPPAAQIETVITHPVKVEPLEPVSPAFLPDTGAATPRPLEMVPLDDTAPRRKSDVQLEPESLALHDLAYACVLIPRLPAHHLTGAVTGLLNVEMTRLCLVYGWRLEHLAIRPLYLHWVVSVAPNVPALQVIQHIREQTSALIFCEFPRLAQDNPSGDFWAPGFMTVHGRKSLAGSLINNFTQQTRARQGIETL